MLYASNVISISKSIDVDYGKAFLEYAETFSFNQIKTFTSGINLGQCREYQTKFQDCCLFYLKLGFLSSL